MAGMGKQKDLMVAGELYLSSDPELVEARLRCTSLLERFNATSRTEGPARRRLLEELLGGIGRDVEIVGPFFCDYGDQITLEDGVYMNFNATLLDVAPILVKRGAMFGPGVQLLTATHTVDVETRRKGLEYGKPITIGEEVWLGGGVIVCPGLTIGDRTVVGAGSVVTKDLPADVVAVGNPARIVRSV
jgi:maltose O-acetyltransferase